MLGAPMKRGEELLGIVITGNRSHKRFTAREVTFLQTLADFAAIAIANTRQLTMSQDASAALRVAYQQLQRSTEATERGVELQTRLSELVLAGTTPGELLAALADSLSGELAIIDVDRKLLAATDEGAGQSLLDGISEVIADRVFAEDDPVMLRHASGESFQLLVRLRAGGEPLGILALLTTSIEHNEQRLLQAAASPIGFLLVHERAQADAERSVRGELLDDLISNKSLSPNTLRRRAERIGWDASTDYVIVVTDSGAIDPHRIRLAGGRLATERRGLMTEREERLVLLLPSASPQELVVDLESAFRSHEGGRPTVAIGRVTSGAEKIPSAHRGTQQALTLALALGQAGSIVFADQTSALGIILGATQPDELADFVERTLGSLLEHDRTRRSDLVATLEFWFASDGHMNNAAAAAHVHVNTLYKRMARIDELLGAGWRKADERLQIQLALRLRRLAAGLDSRDGGSRANAAT